MTNTLVSICMPIRNGERFIRETLESVLAQTYNNVEILIGENCSTDRTAKILNEYTVTHSQLRVISYEKSVSFAQSCNRLISEAKGKYVAIFHADDLYDKTIVEKSVRALEDNANILGVFSSGNIVNAKSQITRTYPGSVGIERDLIVNLNNYVTNYLNDWNPLICPSAVIRKQAYIDNGCFDESLRYIEDLDMWLRLLKKGNLLVLAEHLVSYRMYDEQGGSIYGDKTRSDLSIPLKYMKKFVEENNMMKSHGKALNKAMAKDYLKQAFFAANQRNYSGFHKAIKQSQELYRFYKNIPYFIFQSGVGRINYFLVSNLLNRLLLKNKYY